MMWTYAAVAVAEDPEDFALQMNERGAQGQQDWAAGFTLGCEKSKSSWPAKATGPNDRAVQRQINDGSKAGLETGEIHIIGQWLAARNAANLAEV